MTDGPEPSRPDAEPGRPTRRRAAAEPPRRPEPPPAPSPSRPSRPRPIAPRPPTSCRRRPIRRRRRVDPPADRRQLRPAHPDVRRDAPRVVLHRARSCSGRSGRSRSRPGRSRSSSIHHDAARDGGACSTAALGGWYGLLGHRSPCIGLLVAARREPGDGGGDPRRRSMAGRPDHRPRRRWPARGWSSGGSSSRRSSSASRSASPRPSSNARASRRRSGRRPDVSLVVVDARGGARRGAVRLRARRASSSATSIRSRRRAGRSASSGARKLAAVLVALFETIARPAHPRSASAPGSTSPCASSTRSASAPTPGRPG